MLTGDNGILTRAGQAKTMNDEAEMLENIKLAYNSTLIGKYNREDGTFANRMQEELEKTYGAGNATVTDNGDDTLTVIVKGKRYDIDGDGNAEKHISKIPSGLKIGSTVTYKPSGTFTWEAELCSSTKTPVEDDVTLQTVASGNVTTGNTDMSITNWKVLSIDKQNEKVELISTSPSPGSVYLGQAQGYNNAVYLLNKACNELYGGTITKGGTSYTIEGRNLNIKDIEDRMTDSALNTAHSYGNYATYGHQHTNAQTTYKDYPTIYSQEYNSVINGNKNERTTSLNLWSQSIPIYRSDSVLELQSDGTTSNKTTTDGKVTATTSLQAFQTEWYGKDSFMQTAFKAPEGLNETDGTQNTYYNLYKSSYYWLASRSIDIEWEGEAIFQVRYVDGGYIYGNTMGDSLFGWEDEGWLRPVRPVVSLNAELISLDGSNFKVE